MRARSLIPTGALLAAMLSASPAGATQSCSNVLADGRVILQGPLFTTLGQVCSVAVIPRGAGLTVIARSRFGGDTIVLSPPFAVAPQRVVVVEQPFGGTVLLPSPGVAVGTVVPFTTSSRLVTVPTMRTTTGSLAPLTTFSNSLPPAGVVVARPGTVVVARPAGSAAGRR